MKSDYHEYIGKIWNLSESTLKLLIYVGIYKQIKYCEKTIVCLWARVNVKLS